MRALGIGALALSFCVGGEALYEVQGTVQGAGVPVRVLIVSITNRQMVAQSETGATGSFTLRGVPGGTHIMQVVTPSGQLIHQEAVSVPSFNGLEIRLQPAAAGPAPGPISMRRLAHVTPKPACRSWQRALDELRGDHPARAAAAAEETLRFDPDHADALELLAAMELNSGRPEEAERFARRAFQADPDSGRARFFLAMAQLRRGALTSETLDHLRAAARSIPKAQEVLERLGRASRSAPD
jgi:hypothetical protein